MEIILMFLTLGVIVGMVAHSSRGRGFAPWFFYGILVFPVAIIHILLAKNLNEVDCQFCGGRKLKNAQYCKNCGRERGGVQGGVAAHPLPPKNLLACVDCGKMISKRAPVCPNCGAPRSS